MRNNILGGLVVFFAVVTCLILLDDISSPKEQEQIATEFSKDKTHTTDLAVIDTND